MMFDYVAIISLMPALCLLCCHDILFDAMFRRYAPLMMRAMPAPCLPYIVAPRLMIRH